MKQLEKNDKKEKKDPRKKPTDSDVLEEDGGIERFTRRRSISKPKSEASASKQLGNGHFKSFY